jgi:hypothetical protein
MGKQSEEMPLTYLGAGRAQKTLSFGVQGLKVEGRVFGGLGALVEGLGFRV